MTRRRILITTCAVVGIVVIMAAQHGLHRLRHFPEAYQAWDTGSLLVAYMQQNDDRWPKDWDDLLSVLESEKGARIRFRGGYTNRQEYVNDLRNSVRIDWSFDPSSGTGSIEIASRPDGSDFPMVWENAHPNDIVRHYLESKQPPK